MDRRQFLRSAALATTLSPAALAAMACGSSDNTSEGTSDGTSAGSAPAASGGATQEVKIGFIALTDSASVIMAQELGYYAERGINAQILKQQSWPALRDALLNGEIDCAHALYSMPFSVATSIGGPGTTDLKIAMLLNNNGQGITLSKDFADVGYGDLAKAGELLRSSNAPELAMTFPGGTHDLWLRYWLAACGVDSSTLSIAPVPPPQMVQNMGVGNVKGYCVGEPWNAVAVDQGIGFTHLTTQDLWLNHPEKALVANKGFAEGRADALKAVMGAVLQAGKWLDEPANRSSAADTLGQEKYVNAAPDSIRGRLTGVYQLGADLGEKDFAGEQMQFFRNGETNYMRRSYGWWAMAQYVRLGLLPEMPTNASSIIDDTVLIDMYAEVAAAEGITVPTDDMSPFEVRLDGITFDPAAVDEEISRPIGASA
jgi:nitrate/nitrite transport system substrate-binding protein